MIRPACDIDPAPIDRTAAIAEAAREYVAAIRSHEGACPSLTTKWRPTTADEIQPGGEVRSRHRHGSEATWGVADRQDADGDWYSVARLLTNAAGGWTYETTAPVSEPKPDPRVDAVLFFAEIAALEVPRLLDRLAHMREARDAARAEVERLAGQVEAVRAEVATDGAGWVEFIMPKTGTTHIAYVYEGGGTYLPDGELDSMNLLEATARGKAWRMVRATDVLAILTPRAES